MGNELVQTDNQELAKRFSTYVNDHYFPPESFIGLGYAPPGGYVKDFSVIFHEGRLHLFHIDGRPEERCVCSGNELSFGHASTHDYQHWVRHRLPLAVGDHSWDNEHVWAPYVTRWKDRFYMFYMASGKGKQAVITYATSDDLETWTKWDDAIWHAEGRDPFIRIVHDEVFMYYTGDPGIKMVRSKDMVHWSPSEQVMFNPDRPASESCSVHECQGLFVLWYNDYYHCDDASGDFRAVYAFSGSPTRFSEKDIVSFEFSTTHESDYVYEDWVEKRTIPVSIELVEQRDNHWLVCYFRWHKGRFRLFFGHLDWERSPARITEIISEEQLSCVLKLVRA